MVLFSPITAKDSEASTNGMLASLPLPLNDNVSLVFSDSKKIFLLCRMKTFSKFGDFSEKKSYTQSLLTEM